MAKTIYGDLNVKRSANIDRRLNQGLSIEVISSSRLIDVNDYAWIQVSNSTIQDVVLPDATTLLNGWSVVIGVDVNSVASSNVKSYDAITPVLLRNILVNRAYRFTLLDNSTAAGVWHIDYLEEADRVIPQRYVDSFNSTIDWSGPSNGYYSRTVTETTHGMGSNPKVVVREGTGPYYEVFVDQVAIATNGDVTISVTQSPDLRFSGQTIIM